MRTSVCVEAGSEEGGDREAGAGLARGRAFHSSEWYQDKGGLLLVTDASNETISLGLRPVSSKGPLCKVFLGAPSFRGSLQRIMVGMASEAGITGTQV